MNMPAMDAIDEDAIRHLRALAMDAVQAVGNGHPGTAMALAPAAYLLFQRTLRHDPQDPVWLGRDRFVLSAGHSSLTLYSQLLLSGYGLTLDDLRNFRRWESLTPGHPEYRHTAGVETTTGPLGQGVATAVGMAMGQRYQRQLLDPEAPHGDSPFDHHIWVLASDGDLQEGVSGEASSLAGTQELGMLCVIWDDNRISIEGDTALAFTEDVVARYRAYGWAIHQVEMLPDGNIDLMALEVALQAARQEMKQPTFIRLRTTIAWPAPNARNTAKSHGSALGDAEVAATKQVLGLDPGATFAFPGALMAEIRQRLDARIRVERESWERRFRAWADLNSDKAGLLERLQQHSLPDDLTAALPEFALDSQVATRKASGQALNALAGLLPELWGGSADLAESNDTTILGSADFLPNAANTRADTLRYETARVVHYGIREHAMGAIMNGIALEGLTRPFAGTFLVFSDYMRPAVRLAALMNLPVIYVWTHDSIGLGEDGPTHQPIEHLWALRAVPQLAVVRPADANETSAAWLAALHNDGPTALILTRQNVRTLVSLHRAVDGVARGAYVLRDAPQVDVVLLGTGSEVQLALAAADELATLGVGARVVSMPCLEWFDAQSKEYQESVLPRDVTARIAVEAGATLGWWKYVGDSGQVIGIDHFGASASAEELFHNFGVTSEAVVQAALHCLGR
ncbi:MAG: transketolase [Actinomycetales bacterium]|nr:transketolase [Actinomycetales bacterium]